MNATTEPQPAPRDNSDLPEHRVAMAVFTTVRAVDELDAAFLAKAAIRQAFARSASDEHEQLTLIAKLRKGDVPVAIAHVMEVGMAASNGHLWIAPTALGYPREEG